MHTRDTLVLYFIFDKCLQPKFIIIFFFHYFLLLLSNKRLLRRQGTRVNGIFLVTYLTYRYTFSGSIPQNVKNNT